MNEWEKDLKLLLPPTVTIPHRYELRPGKRGPRVYCADCACQITRDGSLFLDEVVEDAMKHELANHH